MAKLASFPAAPASGACRVTLENGFHMATSLPQPPPLSRYLAPLQHMYPSSNTLSYRALKPETTPQHHHENTLLKQSNFSLCNTAEVLGAILGFWSSSNHCSRLQTAGKHNVFDPVLCFTQRWNQIFQPRHFPLVNKYEISFGQHKIWLVMEHRLLCQCHLLTWASYHRHLIVVLWMQTCIKIQTFLGVKKCPVCHRINLISTFDISTSLSGPDGFMLNRYSGNFTKLHFRSFASGLGH